MVRRNKAGITLLEVSLAFVVGLPLLFGGISVVDLLLKQTQLSAIVKRHANDLAVKPFRMASGDQAYFLRRMDEKGGDSAAFHERLDDASIALAEEVGQMIGEDCVLNCANEYTYDCTSTCGDKFRVEIRYGIVGIDTETGRARYFGCKNACTIKSDDVGADGYYPLVDGRESDFDIVAKPQGVTRRFFRVIGDQVNSDVVSPDASADVFYQAQEARVFREYILRDQMYEMVNKAKAQGGSEPFVYAIPTAFFGVTQELRHGYTEVRNRAFDKNDMRPINYLRKSMVLGVHVQWDITDTFGGSILTHLFNMGRWTHTNVPNTSGDGPAFQSNDGDRLVLSEYVLTGPRQAL